MAKLLSRRTCHLNIKSAATLLTSPIPLTGKHHSEILKTISKAKQLQMPEVVSVEELLRGLWMWRQIPLKWDLLHVVLKINLQSNHMNRTPNAHSSSNGGIGQRGVNVPQVTPQMRPGTGTAFRNTGNNIQSKGTPNAGGCFNGGIGKRGVNVPPNTPQMRPGNETAFRSAGNSIQSKGTTNAGCGFQGGISQRGTSAASRTTQMRPSVAYDPRPVNQGARFNTPTGNQPTCTSRAFQTNQSSPLPHGRGRPVPGMGGNARPPTPVTTPRSGPTPPRQNPGQEGPCLHLGWPSFARDQDPVQGQELMGAPGSSRDQQGYSPNWFVYLQFILQV